MIWFSWINDEIRVFHLHFKKRYILKISYCSIEIDVVIWLHGKITNMNSQRHCTVWKLQTFSLTRVPPIKAKLSDHAPKFSKVVVTLVDYKNGLIIKFEHNLKWRRAAEKSLNFSRTSELLTAFRAVSAVWGVPWNRKLSDLTKFLFLRTVKYTTTKNGINPLLGVRFWWFEAKNVGSILTRAILKKNQSNLSRKWTFCLITLSVF